MNSARDAGGTPYKNKSISVEIQRCVIANAYSARVRIARKTAVASAIKAGVWPWVAAEVAVTSSLVREL